MRIMVLGGAGMLGHKLVQTLTHRGHEVHTTIQGLFEDIPVLLRPVFYGATVHAHTDARDFPKLTTLLETWKPDALLNCIGVIKQREEAKNVSLINQINAQMPHQLAEWSRGHECRFVHFSTDCVFSGRSGGYSEDSEPDPEDLYGQTKLLGEVSGSGCLTLRSSIIGREISHFQSLVEWFLSEAGSEVSGYTQALYAGMTTQTMADLVSLVLELHPDLSGLYHAVSEPISKYDLLVLLRDAFRVKIEIHPDSSFVCDRTMVGDRLYQAIGWKAPSWKDQVEAMADDVTTYRTYA